SGDEVGQTLTAHFTNAGDVTVDAGFNGQVKYIIEIPSGDTLEGASDTIVNTGNLNLSHVCVGSPPPEVPEAPFALLLPIVALGAIGGYFLIQRRRSSTAV